MKSKLLLLLFVFSITSCMDQYDYYHRGIEKIEIEDYEGAKTEFSKAIALDKSFIDAYRLRGKVKSFLGNYSDAILDYSTAIKINPQNNYSYQAYYDRGLAKMELTDYKGAVSDFTKDIQFEKTSWITYAERGLAKYYLKEYQSAIKDCDSAIEIHNYMGYSYYIRGINKLRINDWNGACLDLEKASELNTIDGIQCRDTIEKYCKPKNLP